MLGSVENEVIRFVSAFCNNGIFVIALVTLAPPKRLIAVIRFLTFSVIPEAADNCENESDNVLIDADNASRLPILTCDNVDKFETILL